MKHLLAVLLALVAFVAAGCSSATPRAVVPQNSHDFGNVPVVDDMRQARLKEFVIRNDGDADLKLSGIQVKTLEGC